MNVPAGGIRGFFEVLMPGVFLLVNLVVAGCVWNYPTLSDPAKQRLIELLKDPSFSAVIVISFGYLFGVILRLWRTELLDRCSAVVLRLRFKELFTSERFFYRKWTLKKCERLPDGAESFFQCYWNFRELEGGAKATTLFNFHKVFVAKHDPSGAAEIAKDEAIVRFAAGSFWALFCSILLIGAALVKSYLSKTAALQPLLFLELIYIIIAAVILWHFRFLRCKEVDTVFHVSLANREKYESSFPMHKMNELERQRKRLLMNVWAESIKTIPGGCIPLEALTAAMRRGSETTPELTAMYFAGADIDHPFFLKTDALAIGISVLPEDAEKAGRKKRHPHQTEVIFVLDGELILHLEGKPPQLLAKASHFVIERNTCHWITPNDRKSAVYVFVKTSPAMEPRGEDCG